MARSTRTLLLVWLGLMCLLTLTVGATFAPIPPAAKPVANLAIAFAKAGLVLWFFMELRTEGRLVRVFALAALAWLLILLALTQTDLLTRSCFLNASGPLVTRAGPHMPACPAPLQSRETTRTPG